MALNRRWRTTLRREAKALANEIKRIPTLEAVT
jgi:hypothetical protein